MNVGYLLNNSASKYPERTAIIRLPENPYKTVGFLPEIWQEWMMMGFYILSIVKKKVIS
jgi:hypothetical protein